MGVYRFVSDNATSQADQPRKLEPDYIRLRVTKYDVPTKHQAICLFERDFNCRFHDSDPHPQKIGSVCTFFFVEEGVHQSFRFVEVGGGRIDWGLGDVEEYGPSVVIERME